MSDAVLSTVGDRTATIVLNRPDSLNGLTPELLESLLRRLEEAADQPDLNAVVITGSGHAFSAGGDLSNGLADAVRPGGLSTRAGGLRRLGRVVELLHDMAPVTVAAVNGACAGAGLSLALACDLRIARRRARFNSAFLQVAMSGDLGSAWLATSVLGPSRAREILLLPGRITAEEALSLGILTRVVDDDVFDAQVEEIVTTLGRRAPLALRSLKANLVDAERLSLAEYLDAESVRVARCMTHPDGAEAVAAFLDKREPRFGPRDA